MTIQRVEGSSLFKQTSLRIKVSEKTFTDEERLIARALQCLERRIKYYTKPLSQPVDVCNYLRLQLGTEVNEIFGVLFLDNKHRVLAFEKLFQGTINMTIVYGRVLVQRILAHNAAAIIFVHNHPSGDTEPSADDKALTQQFRTLLKLMDVSVLDHFIVSAESYYSFVEHGLM